jgi:pimeloyl-ACP methyl ester carboxylesterase
MTEEHVHRAVSADGTELAARRYGQGPPLVLVHGAVADENEWNAAGALLARHFTCYAVSLRGRGRSGHSDDLSPDRLVEDVVAVADSVGAPVRLAGISGGGTHVLGAAARARAVVAAVAWEPVVNEAVTEDLAAGFQEVLARTRERYEAGRAAAAVETFLSFIGNDRELAALGAAGEFEAGSRYLEVDLREIAQGFAHEGPGPTDPSVLREVTAPVLLMLGAESRQRDWFRAGAEHVATHLPHTRIRVVTGVGHLSCQANPEPIVAGMVDFLGSVPA